MENLATQNFKCECKKSFRSLQGFQKHKAENCGKDRSTQCNICNVPFANRYGKSYITHMKDMHSIYVDDAKLSQMPKKAKIEPPTPKMPMKPKAVKDESLDFEDEIQPVAARNDVVEGIKKELTEDLVVLEDFVQPKTSVRKPRTYTPRVYTPRAPNVQIKTEKNFDIPPQIHNVTMFPRDFDLANSKTQSMTNFPVKSAAEPPIKRVKVENQTNVHSEFLEDEIEAKVVRGAEPRFTKDAIKTPQRKQFSCLKCQSGFKTMDELVIHTKSKCTINKINEKEAVPTLPPPPKKPKVDDPNGIFKCAKCSKIFDKKGALQNHAVYECGKANIKFQCDFCGFKAKNKISVSKHIEKIHKVRGKLVQHIIDLTKHIPKVNTEEQIKAKLEAANNFE